MDYDAPIKVKHMRCIFNYLGSVWADIGKHDTDLNLMLSSPVFRHCSDPDRTKLNNSADTLQVTASEVGVGEGEKET